MIASVGLKPKMNIIAHEIAHILVQSDPQPNSDAGMAEHDAGLLDDEDHIKCLRKVGFDGKLYQATHRTLLTGCTQDVLGYEDLRDSLVSTSICNRMLKRINRLNFINAGGMFLIPEKTDTPCQLIQTSYSSDANFNQ